MILSDVEMEDTGILPNVVTNTGSSTVAFFLLGSAWGGNVYELGRAFFWMLRFLIEYITALGMDR